MLLEALALRAQDRHARRRGRPAEEHPPVCLSRHRLGSFDDNCIILQESAWADHEDDSIREMYADAMEEMSSKNYRFINVPIEEETLKVVDNPNHGKNMFALGLLLIFVPEVLGNLKVTIGIILSAIVVAFLAYRFGKRNHVPADKAK